MVRIGSGTADHPNTGVKDHSSLRTWWLLLPTTQAWQGHRMPSTVNYSTRPKMLSRTKVAWIKRIRRVILVLQELLLGNFELERWLLIIPPGLYSNALLHFNLYEHLYHAA